MEISVVIPCLNEAETLEACILKAQNGIRGSGRSGEVIIADNGSIDGSCELAEKLGVRVVHVSATGYGNALMGGIEAAHGRYIIMGDADDSYDFQEIPRFVEKLREGYSLVQGCRLPSGGGVVAFGAMPWSHRWIGNPFFSWLVRWWFHAPIHDVNCGLRGFTRDLYNRLEQRCTGMEFATEMVIKASLRRERIFEIPITLYRDGRTLRTPHLRTMRDGWRTLRFYLLCSPRWLFLAPGIGMIFLGLAGYAVALPGLRIAGLRFDVHTLVFATLFLLCGWQAVLFAVFAKVFAIAEGLLPPDAKLEKLFKGLTLERGILVALAALLAGSGLLLTAVYEWYVAGFGDLDPVRTLRRVIPGTALFALAFQTVLAGFFISMLSLRRK